ncbi:MFS transporter [Pseudonocardia alni]|uniref:MFS transporter n=1 Tax=Pseudonocardia alni TaxID=33907 RepID=UPI00280B3EC6|nr:MFS transporter [Pseudonocardia alni]
MSVPHTATGRDAAPDDTPAREGSGLVLACLCTCTVVVMSLVAAINLAVPALAADPVHPGSAGLLWIVDAYVVVFACLVIPGGAAGDRLGRKGVLIGGLATFAAGAALSALAPSAPLLIIGRAIAGLGAALVLPNCVGIVVHTSHPAGRGRALAVWGTVSGLGGLVGNTAGAALLTGGSWRSVFWATVVVALGCLLWVSVTVPRTSRSMRGLDPWGTGLFVVGVVALLMGVIEGPEAGWASTLPVTAFAVAGVALAVWTVVELRVDQPLLDPRLFRIPELAAASVGMCVTFFGSFGLFFLNATFLQYSRGFSALEAGFATLPLALPMLVGSRLTPALVQRRGVPVTLALAFVLLPAGLFGLSTAATHTYVAYAAWLAVIGTGLALALPALTAELTAAVPADQAGVAGGLQSATRELGSALGVAVVGTVMATVFAAGLPMPLRSQAPHTVADALASAPGQRPAIIQAFTDGADTALGVTALVTLVIGTLVVAVAQRAARRAPGSTATP